MKIRIGHSPDADDAFMFYALAKRKIPSHGFEIEHVIDDIESLNRRAFQAELEVTALSCHAYGFLHDRYELLPYGSSVGEGYGPVVIARPGGPKQSPTEIASSLPAEGTVKGFLISPDAAFASGVRASSLPSAASRNDGAKIRHARIAVPGRYTTAYLALQLFEPEFTPVFTPFDQIFQKVEKGEADFGLLIHEGQLTYQELGFQKVVDLGEWWKEQFDLPLPLGINAIRSDLGAETISNFSLLFKESLDYAMGHREEALRYALEFGRGMDAKRGDRFVGMYVNDYSLDLGVKGVRALELLYDLAWKKGLIPGRLDFKNTEGVTMNRHAPRVKI